MVSGWPLSHIFFHLIFVVTVLVVVAIVYSSTKNISDKDKSYQALPLLPRPRQASESTANGAAAGNQSASAPHHLLWSAPIYLFHQRKSFYFTSLRRHLSISVISNAVLFRRLAGQTEIWITYNRLLPAAAQRETFLYSVVVIHSFLLCCCDSYY